MRAIFSVVGLLLVVAVVGLLATKQLKSAVAPVAPGAAPGSSPIQQSQALQQRVRNEVSQALEQAAAARKDEADK
jgi:hypothetical protein